MTGLAHVPAAGGKRKRLADALVRKPCQALLRSLEAARVERLKSLSASSELLHMGLLIEGVLSLGEGLQSHAEAAAGAARGAKDALGRPAEGGAGTAASLLKKVAAEVQAMGATLVASLGDVFVRVALVHLTRYSECVTAAWQADNGSAGEQQPGSGGDVLSERAKIVTRATRHLEGVHDRVCGVLGPASCTLLFAEMARRITQDFAVKVGQMTVIVAMSGSAVALLATTFAPFSSPRSWTTAS
jgi:hypothetical protein